MTAEEPQVVVPEPEVAPTQDEGMSFEEAMQAALSADAPEDPEVPVEAADEAPPAEETPAPEEPVEAAPEAPAEPEGNKSLARIMEREAQLLERQKKLDDAQPELESLRTRVEAYESAQTKFGNNPINFIRSLAPDMDLKRLAESLWYESQGESAPKAYLEQKAASQHNGELVERIAKIEEGEQERQRHTQQQEAQRTMAQYQGALAAFAESAPAETFPLLSSMRERNPQWVAGAMIDAARNHARATKGQVATPEQSAKAVEEYIKSFQMAQAPAKEPVPEPEPGTSLRNNSTQVQPDREPEDELSDEYLRKKAFEAMGRPDLM